MAAHNLLEQFVAELNANVFMREFAFSATTLNVPGTGQLEIADHLVLIGGLGLAFQLKERTGGETSSPAELRSWFDNKVKKKGVKQIRATQEMLRRFRGSVLMNERGHPVPVDVPEPTSLINIIIYKVGAQAKFHAEPFYESSTAGFVHLISDIDYFNVCRFLATPTEVMEYFHFREDMLKRQLSRGSFVHESALVGQFMAGSADDEPHSRFAVALSALVDDTDDWELSFITRNLGDQIAYREGDESATSHYKILTQLALLSRSELKEFKKRLRLTLEDLREDRFEIPYRMAVPRTDCGFLLFSVPSDLYDKARIALHNFSLASKYDFRVTHHLSLCAKKSGEHIDIEWMYIEGPFEEDPEMAAWLANDYPFRNARERMMPRYHFDTDGLRLAVGDSE